MGHSWPSQPAVSAGSPWPADPGSASEVTWLSPPCLSSRRSLSLGGTLVPTLCYRPPHSTMTSSSLIICNDPISKEGCIPEACGWGVVNTSISYTLKHSLYNNPYITPVLTEATSTHSTLSLLSSIHSLDFGGGEGKAGRPGPLGTSE